MSWLLHFLVAPLPGTMIGISSSGITTGLPGSFSRFSVLYTFAWCANGASRFI